MESNEKTCIACGGFQSDPCKAHIYQPAFLSTTDARFDFADVYYWPCCLERTMGEISKSGFDVLPNRTGGCRENKTHLLNASAVIIYFDEFGKEVAEKVKEQSNEFEIEIHIQSLDESSIEIDGPCVYVVLLPDSKKDRYSLSELEEKSRKHAVLYYGGNNESENLRYHVGDIRPINIYEDLVLVLARQHFGIDDTKFPVFISYARRFEENTKEIMDSIPKFDRWKDTVFLSPGVVWSKEIELAIKNSYLFICILHTGITSDSYIWEEVRLAQLYNKLIVFVANNFDWNYLLNNSELKTRHRIKDLQFLSKSFVLQSSVTNENITYFDIALIDRVLNEVEAKGLSDQFIDPARHLSAQIQVWLNTIYQMKASEGDAYADEKLELFKKSYLFGLQSKEVNEIEQYMRTTGFYKHHSFKV